MSAARDPDRLIRAFLDEGRSELPERAYDAVRASIDATDQRVVLGPWRDFRMSKLMALAAAALAVAVVAVAGYTLLPRQDGNPGVGVPGASPTASPSPSPAVSVVDGDGDLLAGTYRTNPLPSPASLSVMYTVPEGWQVIGGVLTPQGSAGSVTVQFDDVTSLNSDPCQWSGPEDDVPVGTTVNDLIRALTAQTGYQVTVSEPVNVSIGGFDGQRVEIVVPSEPFTGSSEEAPACDESNFRLWSTVTHGATPVYVQGPENRWETNVLDVDGTRLVIVVTDFPTTSDIRKQQLQSIVDSIVIEP